MSTSSKKAICCEKVTKMNSFMFFLYSISSFYDSFPDYNFLTIALTDTKDLKCSKYLWMN